MISIKQRSDKLNFNFQQNKKYVLNVFKHQGRILLKIDFLFFFYTPATF